MSSLRRWNGAGELGGDFIYLHLFLHYMRERWECWSTATTSIYKKWFKLCYLHTAFLSVKTDVRVLAFSLFSIGFIYFLSTLPLCLLQQSAFSVRSCSHAPSGNTLTLRPCYRCTEVNLTAAASWIKAGGAGGSCGQMSWGKWGRIRGASVQLVSRFKMAFRPFSRSTQSQKPGVDPYTWRAV